MTRKDLRLVAAHPQPLQVVVVTDGAVGVDWAGEVVGVEALQTAIRPVLAIARTLGNKDLTHVLGEAVKSLARANALGAGHNGVVLIVVSNTLNVVAEVVEDNVRGLGVELGRLPGAKRGQEGGAKVVVGESTETKLALERRAASSITGIHHLVKLLDGQLPVLAAVGGHGGRDGAKVAPVIANGLDDGTGGVVSPESARVELVHVRDKGARVRATEERPGRLIRVGGAVGEGQVDVAGKVDEIAERLVQSEGLQRLGVDCVVGRAVSPVAVLKDDSSALVVLHVGAGKRLVHGVRLVVISSAFARRAQKKRSAGTSVELGIVPDTLLEGAELGLVVVDELVKGGGNDGAGHRLGVEAIAVGIGISLVLTRHHGAVVDAGFAIVGNDIEASGLGNTGNGAASHNGADHRVNHDDGRRRSRNTRSNRQFLSKQRLGTNEKRKERNLRGHAETPGFIYEESFSGRPGATVPRKRSSAKVGVPGLIVRGTRLIRGHSIAGPWPDRIRSAPKSCKVPSKLGGLLESWRWEGPVLGPCTVCHPKRSCCLCR